MLIVYLLVCFSLSVGCLNVSTGATDDSCLVLLLCSGSIVCIPGRKRGRRVLRTNNYHTPRKGLLRLATRVLSQKGLGSFGASQRSTSYTG